MHRPHAQKGFSLIQVSLLLAAGAMVLAANLPGKEAGDYNQKTLDTLYKLDKVEAAMQAYMASNGRRPCPAGGQYDVNSNEFGRAAGTIAPNAPLTECSGGTPAAPMGPDTGTNNVYMGMIPTKTLGLPDDYAFDAWGRRFSYLVDKRATSNRVCYQMGVDKTQGGILVQYKDSTGAVIETENTMYAYISHGPDAHGAFPPQGSSVAGRINRNSADADTLTNAGVNASFTYSPAIFTNTKVKKPRTATFDDLLYYHRDTRNTCCIGDACKLFDPGAFAVEGDAVNLNIGTSAVTIDINGDGLDDMVVAAPNADPGGRVDAGAVYITFGTRNIFTQAVSVASLDGTNGFAIEGAAAGDHLGISLSVGDMNGDGIQDLSIGAPGANTDTGEVNVIFGGTGIWPASFPASNLNGSTGINGTNGIRATGIASGDLTGTSVSMGDANGDNVSDLITGAPGANGGDGATYLVFGGTATWTGATPVDLNLLAGNTGVNGTNGTRMEGEIASIEEAGAAISSCDVNGDEIYDIIVGAPKATMHSFANAGRAYVLFGKNAGWTATMTLSAVDGNIGFYDYGAYVGHRAGAAVSCGDVNGDGIPDMVVGAPYTDVSGTENGSVYVHYGQTGAWAVSRNLNDLRYNTDGYRLDGGSGERAGTAVAVGPDLNGDGVQDIIIGAPKRAPGGKTDAGGAYIFFGTDTGLLSTNDLTALDGERGVIIDGAVAGDEAGTSVTAGNINGTSESAAVIGAPRHTAGGNANAGRTYMLQGKKKWLATPYDLNAIP